MCVASAVFVCVSVCDSAQSWRRKRVRESEERERERVEDCCEPSPGLLFKCKNKNPQWCRDGNPVPPGTGGLTPWR